MIKMNLVRTVEFGINISRYSHNIELDDAEEALTVMDRYTTP